MPLPVVSLLLASPPAVCCCSLRSLTHDDFDDDVLVEQACVADVVSVDHVLCLTIVSFPDLVSSCLAFVSPFFLEINVV